MKYNDKPQGKHKTKVFFVPFLLFMGLVGLLFLRLGQPTQVAINTASHHSLPAFRLPLLADVQHHMTQAALPKQPYVLNVWGSWCPTCVAEHPMLLQLKQQGIVIIGVNYKDQRIDALNYLNQYGDPFLYSLQDKDGKLGIELGLAGAPESFVVDANGVIRQHIIGEITQENWQNRIKPCFTLLMKHYQQFGDKLINEDLILCR